jgi:hypothetical protein
MSKTLSKPKRVTAMSPQTRLARSRRRERGRWRVPHLHPDDAERALALYRAQRRKGVLALVFMFTMLLGLPLGFAVWPGLDGLRLLGIPVSWLMLAVLPYPAMVLLAGWQLRRAERVEER